MSLPRRTITARQARRATRRGRSSKFAKRRVLIADDNRDAAESLAMLLRLEGHEVSVVHDGQAGSGGLSAI